MSAAAATTDHFERALAEAAIGGAGLSVRLRLAQLQAEFRERGISPDDQRIPAYIAAILPQVPRTTGEPVRAIGESSALASSAPASVPGLGARARHFSWRRALKLAAPLLCLLVAPNIVVLPPPNPDASCVGVDCPGPVPGQGIWIPQPVQTVTGTNPVFFYWLVAILVLGLLTWAVLRMRVYRLQKDSDPDVEPTMNLSVRLGRASLFAGPDMEKLMRLLRLRKTVVSRRIDVKASLRATISQGGFPIFRFGVSRIRPEYLVLSEREMIGDHLPEIGRALHARMAAAQVDAWHYEFQGVPDSLRHDHIRNRQGFESVETVKRRHPDARAFLSAESFDITAGLRRNASWVEALAGEEQPLLLNPRAKEHWHDPENDFVRAGFGNLYAGELDARHYAGFLARGASNGKAAPFEAEEEHDLPAFLAEDRDILLSPMPIAPEEIEAIVANLAHWLDAEEMAWLRTIALFPLLHPGFTHFSGLILSDGKGMDAGRYLKIARLPWLRAGFMPDWLRQMLVQGMTAEEFAEAKSIVQSFFAPEAQRARSANDFIAVHEKEKAKRRKDRFEKRLARSAIPALSDTLLINAFASSAPEDVSLDLPDRRRRRWYQHALVQAAAVTAAGALALLSMSGPTRQVDVIRPPIWVPNATPAPTASAQTPQQEEGSGSTGGGWEDPTQIPASQSGGDTPFSPKKVFGGPFVVYFDWDKAELAPEASEYLAVMRKSAASNKSAEVSCFSDGEYGPAYSLEIGVRRCEGLYRLLRDVGFGRVSWTAFRAGDGLTPSKQEGVRDDTMRRAEIMLYERAVTKVPPRQQPPRKQPQQQQQVPQPQQQQQVPEPQQQQQQVSEPQQQQQVACNYGPYAVFFEWDRYNLSPEGINVLNLVVDNYKNGCEGSFVQLTGHTDIVHTPDYALALGERMAGSVRDFMVKSGIPASRISTMSYGKERPLDEKADDVRNAANRRVEISFRRPAAAN